ncbi:hypothetical protein SAMN02745751_02252 [Dethiosulfatibacter aminovorans DSM 17477]|uniref:Uncharacterized protein n=1 Tax=Dethiosulfatibacter aminovorans DSM 17477 TaxID=1121476 RepID=A0A1M6IAD7_9FIRM|nr:hypothetical protein [Dethiosulfatibacter aminovorans]SHJ31328.1 hypothetical protein SAMN02745751_02252 [Dethiosulfatibacter aminovorans DSM 17477]
MDDKSIESVLKKIIEIDKKTAEEIRMTNEEMEQREKKLQSDLKKREEEIEEARLARGREIFDELVALAEEEKNAIISSCFERTKELDSLFDENKENLGDKVFEKLGFR